MNSTFNKGFYRCYVKRSLDVMLSFVALLLLSPILLAVYILLRIANGRAGAFFLQERPGRNGRPFRIIKFKTMNDSRDTNGKLLPDAKRLTRIGRFVRSTSIDELPQLINVLRGEMSLVGPRPELRYYVDMYTSEEEPILDLKPGITDWASMTNFEQFKGFTQAADPDEFYLKTIRPLKLKLQLYYRYNHSFWGDVSCIMWTIYKVVTHSQRLPKDVQRIVDEYAQQQQQ